MDEAERSVLNEQKLFEIIFVIMEEFFFVNLLGQKRRLFEKDNQFLQFIQYTIH